MIVEVTVLLSRTKRLQLLVIFNKWNLIFEVVLSSKFHIDSEERYVKFETIPSLVIIHRSLFKRVLTF